MFKFSKIKNELVSFASNKNYTQEINNLFSNMINDLENLNNKSNILYEFINDYKQSYSQFNNTPDILEAIEYEFKESAESLISKLSNEEKSKVIPIFEEYFRNSESIVSEYIDSYNDFKNKLKLKEKNFFNKLPEIIKDFSKEYIGFIYKKDLNQDIKFDIDGRIDLSLIVGNIDLDSIVDLISKKYEQNELGLEPEEDFELVDKIDNFIEELNKELTQVLLSLDNQSHPIKINYNNIVNFLYKHF